MAEKPVILVTGGAGYIGSHAVLALRDAGYGVAVIDNLTTGFRWAVPQDVALVEGDIEDQAPVEKLIADQDIKAIMHSIGRGSCRETMCLYVKISGVDVSVKKK